MLIGQIISTLIFGVVCVAVSYLVGYILAKIKLFNVELPEVCKDWNKKYIMEISVFLIGVISYTLFNITTVTRLTASQL